MKREVIILFVILVAVHICGMYSGYAIATKQEQDKAVNAHVGRWTIDRKTGIPKFEYGDLILGSDPLPRK